MADEIIELPAARYTDPDYFAREVQQVFRRVPVIVAMTAEQRSPGDHTNIDIAGLPVLVMREVPTGADRDEVAQLFDFLGRVVATEDLPTSQAQQKALSTGILNSIRFGRNEGGLQQFHRWTNTLLDTPDGELNGLFSRAING